MSIDIKRLADVSNLTIPEEREEEFAREVENMIKMASYLPEDVELKEFIADKNNSMDLREDVVGASLTREQALANAPQKQAGCFVVPKTV